MRGRKLFCQITGFVVVIHRILTSKWVNHFHQKKKSTNIYFGVYRILGSIIWFLFLCQHAYHFTSLPPISFLSGKEHFLPYPRKYETLGTEKLIFPLPQMLLLFKLISRNTGCVSGLHTLLFSHAKKSANNARDRISSCFCPVHVKVSCSCCIKSRRKAGGKGWCQLQ